jgi:preprotein translocase SecE subunit
LPDRCDKISLVRPIVSFFKEVKLELSKVTWPKKQEVTKLTIIVFAISGIVAGYMGGLDYLFTKSLALLVK